MECLWIGVSNSENEREKIIHKGGKLLSGEVANDTILSGLSANGIFCNTLNASPVPTYPEYPDKRIKPVYWKYETGKSGVSVGFVNRKYINLLSKRISLVKEAKKWARENKGEDVTVFVYQMSTYFMAAASAVKKINKNAKIVQIIPDLPQFMDMNMSALKKILKKIDWQSIKRHMKNVDKYILYSKHMAEFLGLADGTWTVMEGSYDASLMADESIKPSEDTVSIMYSGVLDLRYGIKELLDAFAELPENYELWLTGKGNAAEVINERAKHDGRIKYLGYLPTRLDLLNKQKEATMLISTRDPSEPASTYCFPSKIFEYMVSGNPVLSTRINGIPDEYFDYIIPLDSLDAAYLKNKILEVAGMPSEERENLGARAKSFVLKEKNNVKQAEKIINFTKE
ncbi:MAG: glycosyltransferase [Clostridia bacterium]|nr:glycosyltransferase [Clostridia bacterium]